jgi:hypothetical protein
VDRGLFAKGMSAATNSTPLFHELGSEGDVAVEPVESFATTRVALGTPFVPDSSWGVVCPSLNKKFSEG